MRDLIEWGREIDRDYEGGFILGGRVIHAIEMHAWMEWNKACGGTIIRELAAWCGRWDQHFEEIDRWRVPS